MRIKRILKFCKEHFCVSANLFFKTRYKWILQQNKPYSININIFFFREKER